MIQRYVRGRPSAAESPALTVGILSSAEVKSCVNALCRSVGRQRRNPGDRWSYPLNGKFYPIRGRSLPYARTLEAACRPKPEARRPVNSKHVTRPTAKLVTIELWDSDYYRAKCPDKTDRP